MKTFETTLAQTGLTTVPKSLRQAIGALGGGRLVWHLTAEGTLAVRLKHAYPPRSGQTSRPDGT